MFKIQRRLALIAHLNIRTETHGKKTVKAADIKIKFTATAVGEDNLFDVLVPVQADKDNTTSEFFFDEDNHLRAPTIEPIRLRRDPEGLMVSFHDRKEPITIANAKAKGFVINPKEGGVIEVTCSIQGIPDKGCVERLKDILGTEVEFELESEMEDLFSMPAPETEGDKTQGELIAQSAGGRRARGVGRAEGLRQTEVKGDDDPPASPPASEPDTGKRPAAKKKAPAKKKARGKRAGD